MVRALAGHPPQYFSHPSTPARRQLPPQSPKSSSGTSGGKWPKGFAPGPSAHLPTVPTPWPVKAAWGGCGTNKNPISYFVNMTNY